MTDYLVSVPLCVNSQACCKSSHSTVVSILIKIPVRFDPSSYGLRPNEVFARRDTKCRPSKMDPDGLVTSNSVCRGTSFPNLRGLWGREPGLYQTMWSPSSLCSGHELFMCRLCWILRWCRVRWTPTTYWVGGESFPFFSHRLFEELTRERFLLATPEKVFQLICAPLRFAHHSYASRHPAGWWNNIATTSQSKVWRRQVKSLQATNSWSVRMSWFFG